MKTRLIAVTVSNYSIPFSVANPGNVPVHKTLGECMKALDQDDDVGLVWLVGGVGIYQVFVYKLFLSPTHISLFSILIYL